MRDIRIDLLMLLVQIKLDFNFSNKEGDASITPLNRWNIPLYASKNLHKRDVILQIEHNGHTMVCAILDSRSCTRDS